MGYVPAEKYDAILNAIDKAPKPLLIHCTRGQDRTGVICAAYRVAECGWTIDEAIEEMEDYGFHDEWIPLKKSLKDWAAKR